VVVGGGAAGIAAARRLHDAGISCLLLEARPRLGGRAWTVNEPHAGTAIDLGCGWLHSADRNPWLDIAQAQGRRIDNTPPPWMRTSSQPGFPLEDQRAFRQSLNDFFGRLEDATASGHDAPAAAYLDHGGRWNGLIGAVGTYTSGGELEDVSAIDLDRYADSGVNARAVEGYGAVIAAHAGPVPVRLDCPVRRIDHSGRRIRIETAQGAVTADAVVVTVPTPLLADGTLAFTPALPKKTEAAAALPLGLADKLFLTLPDPSSFEIESRMFGRTDRSGTGAYHFRPFGRPLIEGYFGGRLAHELEREGAHAFVAFARSELAGLLGNDFAKRIELLTIHPWASDPWARGSYSYGKPGQADMRAALVEPVDGRLFFAGEACSLQDFSTAHGAYLTGIAAADAIMAERRIAVRIAD
jgi:monoamine oxidase